MLDAQAVVVEVQSIALPYDPRPGFLGVLTPADTPPASKPVQTPTEEELARPPGRSYTVYAARVIDPGQTGVPTGSEIFILQSGGTWEGVRYQDEFSPLLEVGRTYFMGISPSPRATELTGGTGFVTGAPFTRFMVEPDGRLATVDPFWQEYAGVQALIGLTPHDAMSRTLAASVTPDRVQ